MRWWDGRGNRTAAANRNDYYRRHLKAIFEGPCRCFSWWCRSCWWELLRSRIKDPCWRHVDRCQACIAEHALYFHGHHPDAAEKETT